MKYRYEANKLFSIIYSIIIFICAVLTCAKWISIIDPNFVVGNSEISAHISNFSLSIIVYIGIGHTWLLWGRNITSVKILGAFLIILNILCETVMGFINTCDIIDAIYGIMGVILTYIYLLLLNKYGLIKTKRDDTI